MAERNEREDRGEAQRGRKLERDRNNARNDRDEMFDFASYCAELEELQIVDFALVELTLYLDTHPGDLQAVQQFNQLAQRRQQIASNFELKFGPLLQFGHSFTRFPWQWVDTPWPWQV